MGNTGLKLSVLDQSPANENETSTEALQHTIELAKKAEEWGYHRFWVTEHHDSNRVMGSSPEVLISHLLAKTSHIRVGSGGVMLQHYSPYKVAENFNVLASLAPGRVDLGIGRGPGGLPRSTNALQQAKVQEAKPLSEKLAELEQILHGHPGENHSMDGLKASPVPLQPADLFLLGTTPSSGELAAKLSIPYVFALFLNNEESIMREAIETYRKGYDGSSGTPNAMLALPVIVADTDEEAQGYASDVVVIRIRLESGRTFTVTSHEAAEEFGRQSKEKFTSKVQDPNVVCGSQESVQDKLYDFRRRYEVDEMFAVTHIRDHRKRLHSYELLSGMLA